MPPRRVPMLDLMHDDDHDRRPEFAEVQRTLALGGLGWARSVTPRVMPDERLADAAPYAHLRIRVMCQPWVAPERRQHLPEGAKVLAYVDPETPHYTVKLLRPQRVVPLRQYAVIVPTPHGDVRLWPEEFVILDDEES